MKLSNERFEIEIISKSEFVDDYSAKNFGKNFLVTIWNIRISGEPLRNWMTVRFRVMMKLNFSGV